jgi:hypothetical protein
MRITCVVCAAALALAACGGSSKPAADTQPSAPAATEQTAPGTTALAVTTAPNTQPATSSPATAAGTATPPCRASDFTLSYLGGQGAAGHGLLGLELRNTGTATCHTYGYPGVLFLDRAGSGLTTLPKHTTQDYFGNVPLAELVVHPGEVISFRIGVTHGAVPGSVCTTAYGLQVIPPDDTATLRVEIPQGAFECQTATVSPMQPGTSAYP